MTTRTGGCLCGAVRYTLDAPFSTVGACHCRRCQVRTGLGASVNAAVPAQSLRVDGELRAWRPDTGKPKWFCPACGTHVLGGEPGAEDTLILRIGTLDDPPDEIAPEWHVWTSSAPAWDPVPDDGVPHYPEGRPQR